MALKGNQKETNHFSVPSFEKHPYNIWCTHVFVYIRVHIYIYICIYVPGPRSPMVGSGLAQGW